MKIQPQILQKTAVREKLAHSTLILGKVSASPNGRTSGFKRACDIRTMQNLRIFQFSQPRSSLARIAELQQEQGLSAKAESQFPRPLQPHLFAQHQ